MFLLHDQVNSFLKNLHHSWFFRSPFEKNILQDIPNENILQDIIPVFRPIFYKNREQYQ